MLLCLHLNGAEQMNFKKREVMATSYTIPQTYTKSEIRCYQNIFPLISVFLILFCVYFNLYFFIKKTINLCCTTFLALASKILCLYCIQIFLIQTVSCSALIHLTVDHQDPGFKQIKYIISLFYLCFSCHDSHIRIL